LVCRTAVGSGVAPDSSPAAICLASPVDSPYRLTVGRRCPILFRLAALLEILDAIKEADIADRAREPSATIYGPRSRPS
jgi:hypothetical protein